MSRDGYISLIQSLTRMTSQLEACISLDLQDSISMYCKIAGARLATLEQEIDVNDMDRDVALEYNCIIKEYRRQKELGHLVLRSRIRRIA